MGKCMKLVWGVAILLGLVALIHSTPVEVVYTDEGCGCSKMLDYQVNLPYPMKPKVYQPSEYNYKIDVPVPPQAKIAHYTFDFVVEEPHKPKPPPKEERYALFAKIDRIALKKPDCGTVPSYEPPPPPPTPPSPAACACTEYTGPKPHYGYVYKKVQPCRCQRSHCKCNAQRNCGGETHRNNLRKKRDLRALFRPRKPVSEERPGRFVKQYHKTLPIKRQASFPLFSEPMPMFFSPTHSNKLRRSKLVKRDIMGEYDLLEKEREQMDLTLPEIIQYMPETLQPNFKRGQCSFGCSSRKPERPESSNEMSTEAPESNDTESEQKPDSNENITNDKNNDNNNHGNSNKEDEATPPPALYYFKDPPSQNAISSDSTSTFTKRNAAQYNQDVDQELSEPVPPPHVHQNPNHAYHAHQPQSYPSSQPACTATTTTSQPPKYAYDHRGQKYLEHSGHMRLITTSQTVPDLLHGDGSPLQYAGDLNAPPPHAQPRYGGQSPILRAPHYPERPISNAALDKVITDIVHRHPEFIEASSHYGGGLVDPEPWQKQETKDFLQKLIAGRLGLMFGEEEEHYNPYHNIGYSNPYRHQRRSVPNFNYY